MAAVQFGACCVRQLGAVVSWLKWTLVMSGLVLVTGAVGDSSQLAAVDAGDCGAGDVRLGACDRCCG